MGLLKGTHKDYYEGNNLGNYQFTSLNDIINQFMTVYVGDQKIIPKISRIDVAFHAQRAMQELSFDTFKSIKSYQIDLPATLVMPLPHDYVNYTKLSWTDSSGIKHLLYPTKHTNNPFQIKQDDGGNYSFPSGAEVLTNDGFDNVTNDRPDDWIALSAGTNFQANYQSTLGILNGKLMWSYVTKNGHGSNGWGQVGAIYQEIDVSDLDFINLSADGVVADITYTNSSGTSGTATSTIRFGITTTNPQTSNLNMHADFLHPGGSTPAAQAQAGTFYAQSELAKTDMFDLVDINGDSSYVEWSGTADSTKTLEGINVSGINTIYVIALSFIDASVPLDGGFALKPSTTLGGNAPLTGHTITGDGNVNTIDNLSITNTYASTSLAPTVGNEKNSSTWNSYKSITPSENNNDDYEDDTYWLWNGRRYGLEPSHAQVNGSFFIDQRLGRIHFSSNVSGKTVILDYISDGLGTEDEMQVHKFAEEAMYKSIFYAIMSTRANIGINQLASYRRDRFAAIRQAKLRLSNIKLEEITQVLRGKSKQIKH